MSTGSAAAKSRRCRWNPDVQALAERLWTDTKLSHSQIIAEIHRATGQTMTANQIAWHAQREGWRREAVIETLGAPAFVVERLLLASWTRWAEPAPVLDRVRRVRPGTFPVPAGGYRLGGVA